MLSPIFHHCGILSMASPLPFSSLPPNVPRLFVRDYVILALWLRKLIPQGITADKKECQIHSQWKDMLKFWNENPTQKARGRIKIPLVIDQSRTRHLSPRAPEPAPAAPNFSLPHCSYWTYPHLFLVHHITLMHPIISISCHLLSKKGPSLLQDNSISSIFLPNATVLFYIF